MVDLSAMCIGDKVRVIPDLTPDDPDDEEGGNYKIIAGIDMKNYAGEICTISYLQSYSGGYVCHLEEDKNHWYWSEDMLEPVEQVSLMNLLNEC